MANFVVTTTTYDSGTLAAVMAEMETYIETIDDTKTIYVYGVHRESDQYLGVIVHDT